MDATTTAVAMQSPPSERLGRYYSRLIAAGIPEPLVEQIVLDAARRIHEWIQGDVS